LPGLPQSHREGFKAAEGDIPPHIRRYLTSHNMYGIRLIIRLLKIIAFSVYEGFFFSLLLDPYRV
jgi:hypothetical protein